MRRRTVCAQMMILCLLLSACGRSAGKGAEELALAIRAEYIAMTACAGQMDVTADYGERVYEYTMDFTYEKDGELVLTVVEPENIAGITARVSENGTALEFDGTRLETGPLSEEGLSPIDALPALLDYAREGCIAEAGMEIIDGAETVRICCRDPEKEPGEGTEGTLWFDSGTHDLVKGEISVDGFVVVRCEFITFSFQTQKGS